MKITALATEKLHFSLTGLLLAAIVCAGCAILTNGPSTMGTSQVYAMPVGVQDELQIQLGPDGFAPAEVQHTAGTFAILVENSNVSGGYTFRLKSADGTVIKEVQVQTGSAAWTVTLSTGEYTLTEASHPQWLCRITVQ